MSAAIMQSTKISYTPPAMISGKGNMRGHGPILVRHSVRFHFENGVGN